MLEIRPGYPGRMYGQGSWERLSLLCLVTHFEGYYPGIRVYVERPHGYEPVAELGLGSMVLVEGVDPAAGQWYRAFSKEGVSEIDRSIPFVFVENPAWAAMPIQERQIQQLARRRKDKVCWYNCFLLELEMPLRFDCSYSRDNIEIRLRFILNVGDGYDPAYSMMVEVSGPRYGSDRRLFAGEIYNFFELFIADWEDPLLVRGVFDVARLRPPTSKKALEERKCKTKFPDWLLLPPEAYWWRQQETPKRSRVITPMEI